MTTKALARPQPLVPDQDVASSIEATSSKAGLNARGYSDSELPTCRASGDKKYHISDFASPVLNDLATAATTPNADMHSLPPLLKGRQNLQLPSFKSLGISSRVPDALLTPPDETTIHDLMTDPPPTSFPSGSRRSSYPALNMPKTPSPDRPDFISVIGYVTTASEESTTTASNQPTVAFSTAQAGNTEHGTDPTKSDSEDSEMVPGQFDWLKEATDALGKFTKSSQSIGKFQLTLAVASIDVAATNYVVYTLCHTQPCPLTNIVVKPKDEKKPPIFIGDIKVPVQTTETIGPVATTFQVIEAAIQDSADPGGLYIDITYAVPVKFNMNHIPNSPVTTPNIGASGADYFSMNVFPKAVVAMDHHHALNTSVPSSPHPVVAPSSISVSLLERFIPPSSTEEYLHLFAMDAPSVLVDRLIELSPRGGMLVFIYPTLHGATTFSSKYLNALLDPLLRNMVGLYKLSADFACGVGKAAAVNQMLPYETMLRKLSTLLRQLERGATAPHRPKPKYKIMHSNPQVVPLERKEWTQWWVSQESERITRVISSYFNKGLMLPNKMNTSGDIEDVTASDLVREVCDGIKERLYAESDAAREGIEVGVFVVKRTA